MKLRVVSFENKWRGSGQSKARLRNVASTSASAKGSRMKSITSSWISLALHSATGKMLDMPVGISKVPRFF